MLLNARKSLNAENQNFFEKFVHYGNDGLTMHGIFIVSLAIVFNI